MIRHGGTIRPQYEIYELVNSKTLKTQMHGKSLCTTVNAMALAYRHNAKDNMQPVMSTFKIHLSLHPMSANKYR